MSTSTLATRPDHVPEDRVFAFDIHHDAGLLSDPHERIRELASQAPRIFWTPHNGGHWISLAHEDVFELFRTPELFSSAPLSPARRAAMAQALPPGMPRMIALTPILLDPPEHTKFRGPLQRVFSPKRMAQLKPDIERLTHQLIDAVIDDGGCDFFAAVNEQLPVRVFLDMMGLPADRLAEFRALVREVFAPSTDPLDAVHRIRRIADAMQSTLEARREDRRDDLISELWALEFDGAPISAELMEDYAALLFLAGLDTVINGMSFGMRHLARDPALQAELRAHPERIADTTEELLRRYTFTVSMRRVTRDTEFRGLALREDDSIVLYMPAADLDPTEYPDPGHFDPARANKAHIAFGAGPHRCLGSHLARIELQTLYEVVLQRLPEFRLDPERPPVFHAGMMLSMSSLTIRWD